MIIDLKRSIDLRWLFDPVLLFILRGSCWVLQKGVGYLIYHCIFPRVSLFLFVCHSFRLESFNLSGSEPDLCFSERCAFIDENSRHLPIYELEFNKKKHKIINIVNNSCITPYTSSFHQRELAKRKWLCKILSLREDGMQCNALQNHLLSIYIIYLFISLSKSLSIIYLCIPKSLSILCCLIS